MGNVNNISEYVNWLIGPQNLGLARSIDQGRISLLIELLSNTKFECSIPEDNPRTEDAFDLRREYISECRYNSEEPQADDRLYGPASVLEVLVALAIRFDMEVVGNPGVPQPDRLFMEWLDNLGVVVMDSEWSIDNSNLIMLKLSKWMNRNYKDDGKGSIFPLKHVTFNFSKSDIWRQCYVFYYENR